MMVAHLKFPIGNFMFKAKFVVIGGTESYQNDIPAVTIGTIDDQVSIRRTQCHIAISRNRHLKYFTWSYEENPMNIHTCICSYFIYSTNFLLTCSKTQFWITPHI